MSEYLAFYRDSIRTSLRDDDPADYEWTDSELDTYILHALRDVSLVCPAEKMTTLATVADSKNIDISDVDDLLEAEYIEYEVDKDPVEYRNCKVWGTTLRMDIGTAPTESDEDVYLYYRAVHELTTTSTTIPIELEQLVIDGAIAYTALSWVNEGRKKVVEAIEKFTDMETAIDSIDARITQATTDLSTGRALIGAKDDEIAAAIESMSEHITQAAENLTFGRGEIGVRQVEADAAIANVAARVAQSIDDLSSSRENIGVKMTEVDTSIDNMLQHISQAANDLDDGRPFINKVNVGGNVAMEYAGMARTELSNAMTSLSQAKGYLAEDQPVAGYQGTASGELSNAMVYLNQARAYLSEDQISGEYTQAAAAELNAANTCLNQARGYLLSDQKVNQYAGYASAELNIVKARLSEASGFMGLINGKMTAGSLNAQFEQWANNKLAYFMTQLRKHPRKMRVKLMYPD